MCPQVQTVVRLRSNTCRHAQHIVYICGYTYVHSWAHRYNSQKILPYQNPQEKKKYRSLILSQMWRAQMVQFCSSSPSVQYWSPLVKYTHENEQIWITAVAGLRCSGISSSSPKISLVSLTAGSWIYKHRGLQPHCSWWYSLLIEHTYTYRYIPFPNNYLQKVVWRYSL